MSMLFRRQHNDKKRGRIVSVIILTVLFMILFFGGMDTPPLLQRLAYAVGEPFWQAQPAIRREVRGILGLFGSKGELVARNMSLEAEVEKMHLLLTDHEVVTDENEYLQALLNRRSDSTRIVGGVLLPLGAGTYDTIVVDVGSEAGVSAGDRVFASDRVILGTVEHVERHTALVRLFSSPGTETWVILEDSGVFLTAVGRGGGNVLLEPSSSVSVTVGEHVVLPGLTSFLVGIVASIEVFPADAVQKILIQLPVNIYTLQDVFIEV